MTQAELYGACSMLRGQNMASAIAATHKTAPFKTFRKTAVKYQLWCMHNHQHVCSSAHSVPGQPWHKEARVDQSDISHICACMLVHKIAVDNMSLPNRWHMYPVDYIFDTMLAPVANIHALQK